MSMGSQSAYLIVNDVPRDTVIKRAVIDRTSVNASRKILF
jgi:hypothetical protein